MIDRAVSENYLAGRFTCSWPWTTLVLLCDGRIVCGCADPYARRVLGDARMHSVSDIWHGHVIAALRADLNRGGSSFCGDCPLRLALGGEQPLPQRSLEVAPLPPRLFIECTAACNISCRQACCAPETGITRTRQAGMLDFDLFARILDEMGPSLTRIDFFNYGETFLHKRAVEMCERIKARFPQIDLYTSTNGLTFDEATARRLVRSGIDEITFSIDGATQQSYAMYRQRGRLEAALRNLRIMAEEKQASGRDVPFLNWRYILFRWNDSDEEMNLARRLAAEVGADRLTWEITDHPEDSFSRRFVPGTADYESIRHEIWDNNNLGNAIPGAMPRARITIRTPIAGLPLFARPGQSITVRTRIRNLSTRPFPAQATCGRRLVKLGAQLASADGRLINRNHARAGLPLTLGPGGCADVPIDIAAPAVPGRYTLRFDLVSEGIDWFERCGSKVTRKTLFVR